MKYVVAIYIVLFFAAGTLFAQVPSTPTPAAAATPAPLSSPVVAVSGPAPVPAVVKDESMAPPIFLQDIVVQAKALPVVGPYIVKVGQFLFFILTVLTALTAALASILAGLKAFSNQAGLAGLNDKVVAFQNGKVMYWLKYASLAFNAQKPEDKTPDEISLEPRA